MGTGDKTADGEWLLQTALRARVNGVSEPECHY